MFKQHCTILASVFLLAACSTPETSPPELPAPSGTPQTSERPVGLTERPDSFMSEGQEESWDAIDHEACAENGGIVQMAGMLGYYRCTLIFDDAGKACSDTDDCMGKCLAEDMAMSPEETETEAVGKCAQTDSPFGCYSQIVDGKQTPTICVD
ncbi:hypothetical protein [Ponticaulis profundi]|uniref:Secreted protein n=1 Tax=Ponticaulis profundi TaxID=2665222 RepID=A0ABW1S5Y4_9PROT